MTPKEILILFFLLCLSFITLLFIANDLTNHFKVDRIVYSGSMSEGVVGYPQIVSPLQNLNQAEKNLSALLFSSLIKNLHSENGEIKYDLGLASKVEANQNFTEVRVALQKNAQFSNEDEIIIDDILHTYNNLTTEKSWTEEVVDDKTILFKFKNSKNNVNASDNLEILTRPILSKKEDFTGTYSTNIITSGSFKIDSLNKNSDGNIVSIHLKRFNNGEHKLPYLKYYTFYFYADEAEGLSDLQTKELNLLSGISGQIISKIKDDQSLTILDSPMSNNFALFLNQNKQTSLRDQEFRQVLSRAVDRDQLVNQTLGGYAIPVQNILGENKKSPTTEQLIKEIIDDKDNGLFFENSVLYTGQKTATSSTERVPVKISITTINNKELIDTANFVAAAWKKLGVEVEVNTIDRAQLQQVVRDRDFDALLFGFNIKKLSDYESFFHSAERTFPKLNIANYASKKADQLIDNLDAKTLPELSQILETEVPVIMLYKPVFVQALTGPVKVIMPEQINKEEDKYKLVNHWFTGTEKVLPWFELNVWLKDFARNMDLWIN